VSRRDPHVDCRFRYDQMVEFLSGWRNHADMLFTLLNEERAATQRVRDEHPRQRYDFNSCADEDCCDDPTLWICARCEVEYPCDTIKALNGD